MKRDEECIEVRLRPMDSRLGLSVRAYENELRRSRTFHELIWTHEAPAVEKLTFDWQSTREARFRVEHPDVYHRQMLDLMGLADLAEAIPLAP